MSSNSSETILSDPASTYQSREIRFWIVLTFNIASLACSLFQLYHFLTKRALRTALHFHVIVALLCTGLISQLIDIPFYIIYNRLGHVWPETPTFCRFWWYVDTEAFQMSVFLIMWASLERHILVFHETWLLVARKKWLLHYLPLIFFIIYPLLFYLRALVFITCDLAPTYDYTQPWCDYSPFCPTDVNFMRYDIVANWFTLTVITLLSDIVLISRVVWRRRARLRQPHQWRKHMKMVRQLLSVSIFASSFSTPLLVFYFLVSFGGISMNYDPTTLLSLLYLLQFSILFLPFIMLLSLPKEHWWDKWRRTICVRRLQRRIAVAPIIREAGV